MISVVIPFYNRALILKPTIESVLNQSDCDWELILVNDGSVDNAFELVESFLLDDRIKYFYQENKGVCSARNFGARKASGEYLLFLDSDDLLYEDSIENFKKRVVSECKVYNAGVAVKMSNNGLIKYNYPNQEKKKYIFLSGSFIIDRKLFFDIGGYDESLKFSENADILIRLKINNIKISCLKFVSFTYQMDSERKNLKMRQNIYDSCLWMLEKYPEYYSSQRKEKSNLFAILSFNGMLLKKGRTKVIKYLLFAILNKPLYFRNYFRLFKYTFLYK